MSFVVIKTEPNKHIPAKVGTIVKLRSSNIAQVLSTQPIAVGHIPTDSPEFPISRTLEDLALKNYVFIEEDTVCSIVDNLYVTRGDTIKSVVKVVTGERVYFCEVHSEHKYTWDYMTFLGKKKVLKEGFDKLFEILG